MLDLLQIEARLRAYLSARIANLRVLASGWETIVFEFALSERSRSIPQLPSAQPLVLRFYQGAQADSKGAREHLTIASLARVNFRVPRPYAYEPDHDALGAPFMIMDRLA
ncbi:MAG TPA: phosphotransferase, partial [Candidatus Binataceae bacterium]